VKTDNVQWERRRGYSNDKGGYDWAGWFACTEDEAKRVLGLKSWEVRKIQVIRSEENSAGWEVELPERVIDQLVTEAKFSYYEPTEEQVYRLAKAIKNEVLARLPNKPNAE